MKQAVLFLAIVCCLFPGNARGQALKPPTAAPTSGEGTDKVAQKPVEKGKIGGMVVNLTTGEPLKKASINAWRVDEQSGGNVSASTDAAGKFVVDALTPGKYMVSAERNGYVRQAFGAKGNSLRSGTTLSVEPGGTVEANFKLIPQSVVTGKVVDEDGEAVAGAQVHLSRFQYKNGKRSLLPENGANTNDLGEYRIYGVAAGKYFISATYNPSVGRFGNRASGESPENEYAQMYYPGTTDPRSATQVEIAKASSVGGIDLALQKARSYAISGKVSSNIPGQSRPGRVMLMAFPVGADTGSAWQMSKNAQSDADGKFEIRGAMPGIYELTAQLWSGGQTFSAREEVSVGTEDVKGVSLAIAPGWDVLGMVRFEGDTKDANRTDFHLGLSPENPGRQMWRGGSSSDIKDDGSFVFKDVGPEKVRLSAWGMRPGYYLKSARANGQDLLDRAIDGTSLRSASIDLVVSPRGAEAEGSVKNDKDEPMTDATVVLVPEASKRGNTDLFRSIATDQYGHYKLAGIRPGSYSLFAFQNSEPGIWLDPDFLATVEKNGVDLKLEEGGREQKNLKVTVGTAN